LGKRATTTQELGEVMDKLFSDESYQKGLDFKPRPSDVIISPYAKSGTTWLQQIAHGLRTRGSMDFAEITDVTPWIEIAYDYGWDLEAEQVADPRLFKSHLAYDQVPKGCRYIVSLREPGAAFVSFFRFMENWFVEEGSISLEEMAHWRWRTRPLDEAGFWHHLNSWWEQRDNPAVLLLCFEEMVRDLPGTVRRVAAFMGIPLDDELFDIVVHQSSREFMLAHKEQFDEVHMRRRGQEIAGLPFDSEASKVTAGAGDSGRYRLTPLLRSELDEIWREQVESRWGLRDYDALRAELRKIRASDAN
jgi:hypothetical protein